MNGFYTWIASLTVAQRIVLGAILLMVSVPIAMGLWMLGSFLFSEAWKIFLNVFLPLLMAIYFIGWVFWLTNKNLGKAYFKNVNAVWKFIGDTAARILGFKPEDKKKDDKKDDKKDGTT